MGSIKFQNESDMKQADVKKLSEHIIQVSGLDKNLSGFGVYKGNKLLGDYSGYIYLYRSLKNNVYQYSNDGSFYTPPIIPEPSLTEVQEAKISEIRDMQQTLIKNGCNVELSDGTTERFTLTTEDQLSLNSLSVKTLEGEMQIIPWHQADESVPCRFYSKEDMKKITDTCMMFVTYHVTYFRDLRIYVRSLLNVDDINSISYGDTLPESYQSPVLKMLMTQLGGVA